MIWLYTVCWIFLVIYNSFNVYETIVKRRPVDFAVFVFIIAGGSVLYARYLALYALEHILTGSLK